MTLFSPSIVSKCCRGLDGSGLLRLGPERDERRRENQKSHAIVLAKTHGNLGLGAAHADGQTCLEFDPFPAQGCSHGLERAARISAGAIARSARKVSPSSRAWRKKRRCSIASIRACQADMSPHSRSSGDVAASVARKRVRRSRARLENSDAWRRRFADLSARPASYWRSIRARVPRPLCAPGACPARAS